MNVSEIYAKIAANMIKGMMLHEQLADYYDFLGLKGYKRCHEYHFMKEAAAYRGVCRYYLNHHNRLIPREEVSDPKAIPDSWYRYERSDVDINTKRNAVKNGLDTWVTWERDTKKLYEKMYQELMTLGEVASAFKIKELISDVDCELKYAERAQLDKKAIDYDLAAIMMEQEAKHEKYRKKTKKLGVTIC